jgi:hypothetical protein
MRSSKSLILVGVLAVLSFSFMFFSCSDDEAPPTTTVIDDSQTLQEMLGPVSAQVNEHLDSLVATMEDGLSVALYTGTGGSIDIGDIHMGSIPPDSVHENDNWIVSFVTNLQAGLGITTMVDSITYVSGGQASVDPADAEEMYLVHNYKFEAQDTTVSFSNYANRGNIRIADIPSDTATLNGEFTAFIENKVVSDSDTEWELWDMEVTLSDVRVARTGTSSFDSGCPCAGAAVVTVQYLQAENQYVPTMTIWRFDVAFDNGTINVDVSTGNLHTSYQHELCTQ